MVTKTNETYRQHQLRKVAILVATLGEPLADQLLADLPERDAAEVRLLLDSLDEIDPHEYEAVVADFRQSTNAQPAPIQPELARPATARPAPTAKSQGVELDASLLARLEADYDFGDPQPAEQSESTWKALGAADAETLTEMLSAEQPQTIAVVLARLDTSQAAELITKLTPSLQADVLLRLSDLDPADEQALQVVESQLAGWLDAKRQQRQRMIAGHELVQSILQDTSDSQRAVLLTQLSKRNPGLAQRLSSSVSLNQTAVSSRPSPVAARYEASTITAKPAVDPSPVQLDESLDPLGDLEALDDQALLRALQSVDRRTVMLALAGASDSLMKRIVRGLPRRQASAFRQQVRAIGPTRLSDMLEAQQALVRGSRL